MLAGSVDQNLGASLALFAELLDGAGGGPVADAVAGIVARPQA